MGGGPSSPMSKLVGLLTASLGGFLILMEDTVVEFLLLKPPGLLGGFLPLTEVFLLSLMLISLEIDKKKFHFGKFLENWRTSCFLLARS